MASKRERQRRLAREHMLRQQQRRAENARRTRQITMIAVVCLVVVGLGVGGFFLFSQPGTTSNAAASATASASPSSTGPVSGPACAAVAPRSASRKSRCRGRPSRSSSSRTPSAPNR